MRYIILAFFICMHLTGKLLTMLPLDRGIFFKVCATGANPCDDDQRKMENEVKENYLPVHTEFANAYGLTRSPGYGILLSVISYLPPGFLSITTPPPEFI